MSSEGLENVFDYKRLSTHIATKIIDRLLSSIEAAARTKWAAAKNNSVDMLSAYLLKTTSRLSQVRNMLFEDTPRAFSDLYVSCTVMTSNPDTVFNDEYLLSRSWPQHCLIFGSAGSGKSFLAKFLFLELAKFNHSTFPIFIECREVNKIYASDVNATHSYPSFSKVIYNTLGSLQRDLLYEQVDLGLKEGLFTLIIDGLDEMHPAYVIDFMEQIRYFAREHEETKIIVTSRPRLHPPYWTSFIVFRISPLSYTRLVEIISKIPALDVLKSQFLTVVTPAFFEKNRRLIEIPLIAMMLFLTFRRNARLDTSEIVTFYEDTLNALFNRHDATKEAFLRTMSSGLSYLPLRTVLQAFSAITHKDAVYVLDYAESLRHLSNALRVTQIAADPERVFEDIYMNIGIMIADGRHYEFLHRSLQEYLCANFLLSLPKEKCIRAVELFASRSDGVNLLTFLLILGGSVIEREFILNKLPAYLETLRYGPSGTISAIEFFFGEVGLLTDLELSKVESVKFLPQHPEIINLRQVLRKRAAGNAEYDFGARIGRVFMLLTDATAKYLQLAGQKAALRREQEWKNGNPGHSEFINYGDLVEAVRAECGEQTCRVLDEIVEEDLTFLRNQLDNLKRKYERTDAIFEEIFENADATLADDAPNRRVRPTPARRRAPPMRRGR